MLANIMSWDSHTFPKVGESGNEVNPKHYKVGITLGIGVSTYPKILGQKCKFDNLVQIEYFYIPLESYSSINIERKITFF
jgi:hypothetical protein